MPRANARYEMGRLLCTTAIRSGVRCACTKMFSSSMIGAPLPKDISPPPPGKRCLLWPSDPAIRETDYLPVTSDRVCSVPIMRPAMFEGVFSSALAEAVEGHDLGGRAIG